MYRFMLDDEWYARRQADCNELTVKDNPKGLVDALERVLKPGDEDGSQ